MADTSTLAGLAPGLVGIVIAVASFLWFLAEQNAQKKSNLARAATVAAEAPARQPDQPLKYGGRTEVVFGAPLKGKVSTGLSGLVVGMPEGVADTLPADDEQYVMVPAAELENYMNPDKWSPNFKPVTKGYWK